MRILMAAALAATMTVPAQAGMELVCEQPWAGQLARMVITLADDGTPAVENTLDGASTGFSVHPVVLGYTTTDAHGTPFSSIMIESRADDGGTSPARVLYVDWGRAQAWTTFMSMVDTPGSTQLEKCRRTD